MEEITLREFQRKLHSLKGKTLAITSLGKVIGYWTPNNLSHLADGHAVESQVLTKEPPFCTSPDTPDGHAQTSHNCQMCKSHDVTHRGIHYEDGEEFMIYLCRRCLAKYPNKRNMQKL